MGGLGDPVIGSEFINREEELGVLDRRVDSFIKEGKKRNIAVLGLRKVGKTSLMQQFIKHYKKESNFLAIPIYVPEENPKIFVTKAVGLTLMYLLRKKGLSIESPITLNSLVNLAIAVFPKTAQTALEISRQPDISEAFSSVFELFKIAQKESGYSILVWLDEFQRIADYKKHVNAPIDTIREIAMNQGKVMYVIAGSSIGMLTKIIASTESPLFGHFEQLKLKGFDFGNSRKLILQRLDGLSIGENEIGFLFELTDGVPFYIDLLTFRMKDLATQHRYKSLPTSVLTDALLLEVFTSSGGIYSHLTSLIDESLGKKGLSRYLELMKAIARGNHRSIDIARNSEIEYTQFPKYIKQLIDWDIVIKKDGEDTFGTYYLSDTLLEFWLKEVFSLREDAIISEISEKRKRFRSNVEKIIEEYKTQVGLGNEARIRELFKAFDGNISIFDKVLPKFDSVTIMRLPNNEELDVLAVSSQDRWAAEVKDMPVDVGDINDFIRKINLSPLPINQKILICLLGINEDAQKLALSNKIAVWKLDDVNILMKAYSKFRITI
ncbi:MAG: ATP-binding protein [Candidatus Aenigmarchaeota archaeon]|nr:ATP-binding protein [Candidatus Aenigmarchaeota archaeon]